MKTYIFSFALAFIALSSCTKETKSSEDIYASLSQVQADSVIKAKITQAEQNENASTRADLYLEAAEVAEVKEKFELSVSLYQQFLKDFPKDQRFEETSGKMAILLKEKLNKASSASFLEAAIEEKFSSDAENANLKSMLNQQFEAAYPRENAPPVRNEVVTYVDACEIYAMFHPEDPETPEILYKAAESARILQSYQKALMLYDWIIEKYPESDRAPQAYFLKAFTYDDNMKNYREAGELYRQFIDRYPENEFSDDAQFLLENLGKTDEEILKNLTQ